MKALFERLLTFFQDGTGQLSAMRLMSLTWIVGVFIIWAILSILAHTLLPIPVTVLGFMGTLIGGKLIQNYSEGSSPAEPPKT